MRAYMNTSSMVLGLAAGFLVYFVASTFADTAIAVILGIAALVIVSMALILANYRSQSKYREFEMQYANELVEKIKANCIQNGRVRKGCVYALEDSLCVVYSGSDAPANLKAPYVDMKIVSSNNDELHIACPSFGDLKVQSKESGKMAKQIEAKIKQLNESPSESKSDQ